MRNIRQSIIILWFISINVFATSKVNKQPFTLQAGDLLFQDLNCGTMCDSIDSVTYGYHHTYISHAGMIVTSKPNPLVIEAISKGVVLTPLENFLNRSLDENHQPRVMVGRLKPQYQPLIPKAISYAKAQLGKPYNASFSPNKGKSFYCSELLYFSFKFANHGHELFHNYPMNFTNSKNKRILPLWQDYYQKLHLTVPQHLLGSNPGELSRESSITIVYFYGHLRKHNVAK